MKRGFLKSSKAKAHPVGPLLASEPCVSRKAVELDTPFRKGQIAVPKGYESTIQYQECEPCGGGIPDGIIRTAPPFAGLPTTIFIGKVEHERIMTCTTLPNRAGPDDPVSECFIFPKTKELLFSTEFSQALVHPTTRAFRMAPSPGKGMGPLATRALQTGDLILSERPLLVAATRTKVVASPDFTEEQYEQHSKNEVERHFELCVSRMRPDDRAAFMALANCHEEDGHGPIGGIMATNCFLLPDLWLPGDKEEYTAVCKELSRLNHSCSHNTSHRFDTPSFSYQLFAVRDIAAGEELTAGYTYLDCSTAEHRQKLKPYKFACGCAACKDPVASDARRAGIILCNPGERPFSSAFMRVWLLDFSLSDDWLPSKCQEQLTLIAREGLEFLPIHCEAVTTMMEAYICLGDAQRASEWAAKLDKFAWEKKRTNVKALLDPASAAYEAHPMWRKRQKSCTAPKSGKGFPLPEVVGGKIVYRPRSIST